MKTGTKILITAAVCCIVLGMMITAAAWVASGFGSRGMKGGLEKFERKTYTPDKDFENISVDIVETDIAFMPASDGRCRVECAESENVTYTVEVRGNELRIVRHDNRKWYEFISFSWGWLNEDCTVNVYLPDEEYKKLEILSVSGNITLPSFVTFEDVYVKSVSGDIRFEAGVTKSFEAKSTSGEIFVSNISGISGSSAEIQTTSGDIDVVSSEVGKLSIKSVSGDVDISDTVAERTMIVKTTSGDVELNGCDAAEINIKTVSGDVDGILLSDKIFDVDTTSGDIRIPQRGEDASDKCIVDTTSGDIKFRIRNGESF